MRVRDATASDLGPLLQLVAALFAEDAGTRDPATDIDWPRTHGRSYYADLLDDEQALVLLAEHDTAVLGFLVGRLHEPNPLRPGVSPAELESMFVDPSSRSSGMGRDLAEHFEKWAVRRGATCTTVTAYAANTSARRFYRALGYADHKVVLERPTQPT
ncbi:GNAT family N-acetyltransferase [Actinomycetospora sp. NBRC 106378]|uniref:GNAT family N-acetyltransferase n=1 Tax=Actinomycetospora sp. NBRC 106378 TaxID=3032208 RepID=UPI0024A5EC8E|nr:GNAT family N-acetyltransferase [Actinomycetospora sp. NBRC 106378]GLZ52313.1 hypothetical protein Acsp07_19300 [Actinomycetospora sp. NBRC 106378]